MSLNFDLDRIETTEFGIGRKVDGRLIFETVSVDMDIQDNLRQYASDTWEQMCSRSPPYEYDPSDVIKDIDYIYLELDDPMARIYRELHNAGNLPSSHMALSKSDNTVCYFARFTDNTNRRLTAIRRAIQFRIIKKRNAVMQLVDDTLKLMTDPIFKLDTIFDMLIDFEMVHVIHPKSFEIIGDLKEFVRDAARNNAQSIQADIGFVNMTPVAIYAIRHIRAAKYLASIQSHGWARGISYTVLRNACNENDVDITESNGHIDVSQDIMGFLEILDRRRYNVNLIANHPEQFRAVSRQKIS